MSRATAKKAINRSQNFGLAEKRTLREVVDDVYDDMTNLNASTITATTVNAELEGSAMTTERGAGMAGATGYSTSVTYVGKKVITSIYIDVEALVSSATANDIIGDDDATSAHIGRIGAESGTIVSGTMTCLEAPTDGDDDINLNKATVGTGAEDAAVTGLTGYGQLLNAGTWTAGLSQALTALPSADDYLYLSAGTGGAAAYTAGKFVIELVGYKS